MIMLSVRVHFVWCDRCLLAGRQHIMSVILGLMLREDFFLGASLDFAWVHLIVYQFYICEVIIIEDVNLGTVKEYRLHLSTPQLGIIGGGRVLSFL